MATPNPRTSPTAPTVAQIRIGVVQASPAPQADYVWVVVDESEPTPCAFFTGYVPVPGDRVVVTKEGTDWFVLGGRSGAAGNLVLNPDFMAHPEVTLSTTTDSPPWNWGHHTASGSAVLVTALANGGSLQPLMIHASTANGAAESFAYTAAFPVDEGDEIFCDIDGNMASTNGANLTNQLRLYWYAAGDAPFTSSLSNTLVASVSTTSSSSFPYWLNGSGTAPAGATYARLVQRVSFPGGGSAGWQVYTGFAEARR